MTYVRSFWTPNAEVAGSCWRPIYNKYLANRITVESFARLLWDNASESGRRDLESEDIPRLRVSMHVYEHYRSDIFGIYKVVLKKRSIQPFEIKDMKVALERARMILLNRQPVQARFFTVEIFDADVLSELYGLTKDSVVKSCLNPEQNRARKSSSRAKRQYTVGHAQALLHPVTLFLELECFAEVARKTWAREKVMSPWSLHEFNLLATYYGESAFGIIHDGSTEGSVDPSSIEFDRSDTSPIFGMDALTGIHHLVMSDLVADFIDELLIFNKHQSIKGSAQCVECGQMYPRAFYGHGQTYCSAQCKQRAKKRRHRNAHAADGFRNKLLD